MTNAPAGPKRRKDGSGAPGPPSRSAAIRAAAARDRPYRAFGERLRAWRLRAGIATQRQLAERLDYDYTAISHWESGRRCPPLDVLIRLVEVLVEAGGIETPEEANELLRLADRRPLNPEEVQRIFGSTATPASNRGAGLPPRPIPPEEGPGPLVASAPPREATTVERIVTGLRRLWTSHRRWGLPLLLSLLLLALLLRFLGAPWLARHYNTQGRQALLQAQDPVRAMDRFRRAARLDPASAVYPYNLALACQELADLECAIEGYRAALERNPDMVQAYNNLGTLFIQVGRYDDAIQLLRQGVARTAEPTMTAVLYKNLGAAHYAKGLYRTALEELEWSRSLLESAGKPNANTYVWLAEVFCLMGQVHDALGHPDDARRAWLNCLGLAGAIDTPLGREWATEARERLQQAGRESP